MILNCPSCSAKFMISSEALGEEGREVRCGKCGHIWFQASERDSLDDLISPEDTESRFERAQHGSDNIDIGFEPHVDRPEKFPEALKPRDENIEIDFKEAVAKKAPSGKIKHAAAVVLALLIVGGLFYMFVAKRQSLAASMPFLAASYTQLGFSLEQEKPKIAFDRLKLAREKTTISGTGYLINLTSEDVEVKGVRLELTDLDYKILKTTEIHIPEDLLKSESSNKIEFSFADAPNDAVSVRAIILQ